MGDAFGKLVDGINPASSTLIEWFSVPSGHQYQGTIRVTNIGTTDATYRIAGTSASGTPVASKDYEGGNAEIKVGDIHHITMEMGALEALSVYADSADVTFNYRGLDIDA